MSDDEILRRADAISRQMPSRERWIEVMLATEAAGFDPQPMKNSILKETHPTLPFRTDK